MAKVSIVQIPHDLLVSCIHPEIYTRSVFVAEDVRREWQFVSSSLAGIARGIEECCHQRVSLTSLAECARNELRKGYTCGFRVIRLSREAAVDHLNTTKFKRRMLCAKRVQAWRFRRETDQ